MTDFFDVESSLSESFFGLGVKYNLGDANLFFSIFEEPKTRCDRLLKTVSSCCDCFVSSLFSEWVLLIYYCTLGLFILSLSPNFKGSTIFDSKSLLLFTCCISSLLKTASEYFLFLREVKSIGLLAVILNDENIYSSGPRFWGRNSDSLAILLFEMKFWTLPPSATMDLAISIELLCWGLANLLISL